MSGSHRRCIVGLVLAGICLVPLAACGGSGDPGAVPATIGPQSSLAESKGFRCEDPKGDLGTAVKGVGTGTEPAGIDMVVAEAKVGDQVMTVTYQMVGDPNAAPSPFVDLLQGDITAPDFTFELRANPIVEDSTDTTQPGHAPNRPPSTDPGAPWGLTLITFKGGEQRRGLETAVTVSGNTVTYSVPLADLPPIATLQWTFGAASTATDGKVTFDDCNSLTATGTQSTAPEAPGVSLAPSGPIDPNDSTP